MGVHALFTNNGVNVCEHVMNSTLFTTTYAGRRGDAGEGSYIHVIAH
jgi:hypothetical protein